MKRLALGRSETIIAIAFTSRIESSVINLSFCPRIVLKRIIEENCRHLSGFVRPSDQRTPRPDRAWQQDFRSIDCGHPAQCREGPAVRPTGARAHAGVH